jgi:branched-chain amino acid transport system substrate-binding protein
MGMIDMRFSGAKSRLLGLARHICLSGLMAATLAGCHSKPEDPAKLARARAPRVPGKFHCEAGAITIGMVRAMSGGFSFFDTTGAHGAEIAIDMVNRRGGIDGCPIEILRGNTQSDPALARQVAEDLIRQGAQIIVTPGDFDMGVGASQAAQEAGKLSMSLEASASAWSRAITPYHLTTAITELDQGGAIASFAQKKGWNSVYIVTNDAFNVFTATEAAFLKAYRGRIIAKDRVADDASDYAAIISKIRASAVPGSFIFLNDYFPHVGTFIRQLRAAGLQTPVIGNQNFSTPALPDAAGISALSDVYYIGQGFYEGDQASSLATIFTTAYKRKYGVFPENANALAGYEGAQILLEGLRMAKTTEAASLAKAITSRKNQPGATSVIYKWVQNHPERNAAVIAFTVKGRPIIIDSVNPQSLLIHARE